jgi:hypothetical protein
MRLKKCLAIGIIIFLINTSLLGTILIQGKINNLTQEKESQYLENETYTPYLEIVLANETKTFLPTDDTYIANLDPSEVNGDLDILATRNRYDGYYNIWECDILIRFDISSIPRSTTILSASLNLYYAEWGDSNPAGRPLTIYRIKWYWDERTVNFFKRPWIALVASDSQLVPNTVGVGMSWDVTDDVQWYVNHPLRNFGWEIKDNNYWGTYGVPTTFFYSKEYFNL